MPLSVGQYCMCVLLFSPSTCDLTQVHITGVWYMWSLLAVYRFQDVHIAYYYVNVL